MSNEWKNSTQRQEDTARAALGRYEAATAFVLVLGAVYEYFSFGVWSGFMVYAFLFPLAGGVLPLRILLRTGRRIPAAAAGLWNCGIATFTAGCLFCGILEIYGTTNRLSGIYWIAGTVLLAAGVLLTAAEKAACERRTGLQTGKGMTGIRQK
ncbi:MAG: hypothetical protein LKJ76_08865 [Lachnospiraceae bacterium]|jgi:hypothetical protein|nr:hypothetical protein [Lachnospiraceae bacterium]